MMEEVDDTPIYFYVQADLLNGRAEPTKSSGIESFFDYGDIIEATGKWSDDYRWVEVYGGEPGSVWVKISYVSERKGHCLFKNEDYNKVKIRKRPVQGKVIGYIKRGQSIDISQVVLGWGKCDKGWVDLSFLNEVK